MGGWVPGETFEEVFGLRPELFEAFRAFHDLFFERALVDPVLLELCRLRVAQLHGCRDALAARTPAAVRAGLDEAKVAALADGSASALFSPAERAALAFAEKFVRDVHEIDDDDAAAVVRELGEPGTVALAEALALFDGFSRFRLALGVGGEGSA